MDNTESKQSENITGIAIDNTQPQLPENYFLTLQAIQTLIKTKCDTIITKDDPILMIVPILNSYIHSILRLHSAHENAVQKIIMDKTKEFITAVKETTELYNKTLSETSVQAVGGIMANHEKGLQSHKTAVFIATAISVVSVLTLIVILIVK